MNKTPEQQRVDTAEVILDRLSDFIPKEMTIELQLAFAIRPSITMCCHVARIVEKYNSTEDNEKKVSLLLERLMFLHFYPKTKSIA